MRPRSGVEYIHHMFLLLFLVLTGLGGPAMGGVIYAVLRFM